MNDNERLIALPTLAPLFRHDYTVWRSMDRAPRDSTHVQVLMANGKIHADAHWASDLSGEEQPPFEGWFIPWRGGFSGISDPVAWAPLP